MADGQNPLQKTFVNIALTAGLNRKRDAHQLQNGELLTADNVSYSQVDGQICKRNGFASVTPQGAPLQGGPFKAIGCRDNVEPIILGQNTLNKYNSVQNLSTSLPTPTQGRVSVRQVQGSSGRTLFAWPPSHASLATDGNQYVCAVWEEPNATGSFMYFGVQDQATGNWIISPRSFTHPMTNFNSPTNGLNYSVTAQFSPLVRYVDGVFWIFWLWTGGAQNLNNAAVTNAVIVAGTIALTNLAAGITSNSFTQEIVTNSTGITSSSPTSISYDVHFSGNNAAMAWTAPQYTTANVQIWAGTVVGTTFAKTQFGYNSFALSNLTANSRIAVRCDGPAATPYLIATNVSCHILDTNVVLSTTYNAPITPSTASKTYTYSQTPVDCAWINGQAIWSTALFIKDNPIPGRAIPVVFVYNPTAKTWTEIDGKMPIASAYGEQLSRIFTTNVANKLFFWYGQGGPTSDAVYNAAYLIEFDLIAKTGGVICRTLYMNNYHICLGDKVRPTEVIRTGTGQQYMTMLTSGQEKTGENYRAYGTLNRIVFNFSPDRQIQVVPLPTGGVMIAGAYPLYYDGNDVVEAGFSNPPTSDPMPATNWSTSIAANLTVYATSSQNGLTGGASAVTPSGSIEYYYLICFVRRDAYGNVYRSAPSPVITVPCPNPINTVVFPTLTANNGGNIQIEYYRSTQNTPGTYYKLAVVPNGSAYTDTRGDGVTTPTANTSITKNPTIYTNSGELANDPPPPIHHMVCSESRAYIIPADNRNLIWYSKQFSPGRTVEFAADLTMSEGQNSGQFTALAVLDDKLIIFKQDQILYTYGSGPDNGGKNGAFAPFVKIASDVGCTEPASVCVIPDGVVFRSRRGIELLNRSLQVQYIGGNVEPLVQTNGPMSSVVVMPNFTELRFIPSQATVTSTYQGVTATKPTSVLVYDYAGKRWSTYSNMAAVQAVNINNDYWWISADGSLVNKENRHDFGDPRDSMRTSWGSRLGAHLSHGSAGRFL
jgi:hypothetical protein